MKTFQEIESTLSKYKQHLFAEYPIQFLYKLSMRKVLRITSVILGCMLVTGAFIIYRWTQTPFGPLDYKVAIALKIYEPPDITHFTLQELREKFREEAALFQDKHYPELVRQIKDTTCRTSVGNIPVRIYSPASTEKLPLLVYYHGGGFVFGHLDEYNTVCATLSHDIPAIVVSVDYRLAPEHPFPAPVEDAYAGLQWVYQYASKMNGDSTRLGVAGDSAGGDLAAVVAQMARDKDGPDIDFQVLFYPATQAIDLDTDSHRKYGKGFALTTERVAWYIHQYLPNRQDRYKTYASPLLAKDFSHLPPALVIIAGFDPLRSEGEAYAEKLKNAGVPVKMILYPKVIHGFINVPFFDQSHQALKQAAQSLQQIFYKTKETG